MTTDISVNVRWDPQTQQDIYEDIEYDGGNSSSRLFERSRIKALAGNYFILPLPLPYQVPTIKSCEIYNLKPECVYIYDFERNGTEVQAENNIIV